MNLGVLTIALYRVRTVSSDCAQQLHLRYYKQYMYNVSKFIMKQMLLYISRLMLGQAILYLYVETLFEPTGKKRGCQPNRFRSLIQPTVDNDV